MIDMDAICPIRMEPCSDKCAWAMVQSELTDDGVTSELFCSVNIIAGWTLVQQGSDNDGWMWK